MTGAIGGHPVAPPGHDGSSRTAGQVRLAKRRLAGLALGLAFLAAHLPFLAPSLEDIDSINFALALRDFDVASHQPHPPGYPVYVAIGRVSLAAVTSLAPALEAVRAEALALALWSAAGGAAALMASRALFAALGGPRGLALWAMALLAVCPLFWISGLRPLSDLSGLALALVAQALVVRGPARPSLGVAGAFVAGLAAGVRVQTLVLTAPLLILAGIGETHFFTRSWIRRALGVLAAFAAGLLIWLVPLVAISGGPEGYLRALSAQAGEDFAWVDMLWANPTPRRLAFSLYETFVLPWSTVPLAVLVGLLAFGGAMVALVRDRRAVFFLLVAFGPYCVFHLLLQETFTVRYALPLLPAVAWLAARGAMALGPARHVVAGALVAAAAAVSLPAGVAYGREVHPAFRAIADMQSAAPAVRPAAIHSHYSLRRPLQAASPAGVPFVEPPRQTEWRGLSEYWLQGGTRPVWFLADPRRTDLDLIDPHARQPVHYRWLAGNRPELSGTRPLDVDWYRFEPPFWFAGEGWSLTPETGGIVRASGTGLDRRPIEAYVRRGGGPLHVMVGGGFIDPGISSRPQAPVSFELAIDGVTAATWMLEAGRFLHFFDVPSGLASGGEGYATLTIAARTPGGAPAPVAVRQFDIQPAERLIYGLGEGWHDEEYDNVTGLRWRWTSERSVVRVAPARDARLVLRGESPLRYFGEPPNVRIVVNGKTISSFQPADDFVHEALVPGHELESAGGAIAIEVDRVYLPAEAEGSADARRLGLRLFEIAVHPVSP